jgi:hypothetical protein
MCLSDWRLRDDSEEREYEEGNRVLDAAEAGGELDFDAETLFGDLNG